MQALLQRVSRASVVVDGETVGEIGAGLLVFLGVEANDSQLVAQKLMERVVKYRVFADDKGRMNLNVQQAGGAVLLVSQFTLAADPHSGLRPSFTPAAEPGQAESLYEYCLEVLRGQGIEVASGRFAADMQVELLNDGPVTFLLSSG